ncbi:MAG: ABC transporter substrate-binding protein [Chloroflexota bacterium]
MRKLHVLFSLLIVFSMVLAACGGAPAAPAVEEAAPAEEAAPEEEAAPAEDAGDGGYNEAPMLAEMVAAGELPPVEERLPVEPMIITPVDEVGTYGGTLRRAYLGPADGCNYWRISRGGLFRFTIDGFEIVPAVAKGYESNEDGTEWTVFLREGMSWSDGDDFNANDFMWQYENVLMNEELTPVLPAFLRSGDSFGTMEMVDDYTVKFIYPNPNTLFLEILAQADQACGGASRNIPYTPSHYMEQFHGDFNEGAQAMAEEAGFEGWPQLYDDKVAHNTNGDERPTTRPWKFQNVLGDQIVTASRNPYFYAVDTAGNQLPYIDEVTFTLVEDIEVLNLKAVEGDIDFQGRHIKMENVPTLKQGEEVGGYVVTLWPTFGGTDVAFYPNLSYEGPEGEALRDATFRQALSIAIDREAIREISMLGLGVPRQSVPAPGHPHYPGEEWEFKYTEYDVATANEMLDSILPDKDDEGFRTIDGERIVLPIGVTPAFGAWPDVAQQVSTYWEAVGVKAEVEELTRSLLTTRHQNNEFAVYVWNEDTTGFTFSNIGKRVPESIGNLTAPAWGNWVDTGGEAGIEPPAWMMEFMDKHLQGPTLPAEERNALGQEIYRELVDNVYNIGIVGLSPMVQGVIVTNAKMRNVPPVGGNDWPLRTPSTAYPEQLFYAE